MLVSLDEVLSARRVDESVDAYTVPPGFGQGKATYGGLVIGACLRSMTARVPTGRRLRSASAQLLGAPQRGEATLRTRLLRSSGTVSTLATELDQGGEALANVVGVFGSDRPVPLSWNAVTAPDAPSWRDVEALDTNNPLAPEFMRNFEFRSTGALPFSGSTLPTSGFVRPVASARTRDAAYVICMLDAWWLATFTRVEEFRPTATLTFNVELHAGIDDLDPDEPFFHLGEALTVSAGYALETRRLFGADKRLVATTSELITIIK